MKVPRRSFQLAGLIDCPAREVEPREFQGHLTKHVFGAGVVRGTVFTNGGSSRWDYEGWSRLEPAVITDSVRRELVEQVLSLEVPGESCGATDLRCESRSPEFARTRSPCRDCGGELAKRCEQVTGAVGSRYAQLVNDLLDPVRRGNGVLVPRAELDVRLCDFRLPDDLVVLSAGALRKSGQLGVRVSRADGVRVEFTRNGSTLRWRTTYRDEFQATFEQVSFVGDLLSEVGLALRDSLSGKCVVPRLWWEGDSSHVA
ncbi:MAG: hypothetical protein KF901_00085 [Myxococcales bacterium]|nr:hypothetical protein [Myxococcales bacterium]